MLPSLAAVPATPETFTEAQLGPARSNGIVSPCSLDACDASANSNHGSEVVADEAVTPLNDSTLGRRDRRRLRCGSVDQPVRVVAASEAHVYLRQIPCWGDVELEVADAAQPLQHAFEELRGRLEPA